MPSPGRTATSATRDLPLDERQEEVHQLAEAELAQRAAVDPPEIVDQPRFAIGIDEGDLVLLLAPAQFGDLADPLVHDREQSRIEGGDLGPRSLDNGVGHRAHAATSSSANSSSTLASISRLGRASTASGLLRSLPVTRTTTRSSPPIWPRATV